MNDAVGKSPSVTAREFVLMYGVMTAGPDEEPWYEVDYPEDAELRDSFRLFAEQGELADEYADAGCDPHAHPSAPTSSWTTSTPGRPGTRPTPDQTSRESALTTW